MVKRGGKVSAAIIRPRLSEGIFNQTIVKCADNSGVLMGKVINVFDIKTRRRRVPGASVGDMVKISVTKGKPELIGQLMNAVVIRQRKPYKRIDGTWISFEDNAVIILTPEGDVKGTEIIGPVAKEAVERWPKIASIASIII